MTIIADLTVVHQGWFGTTFADGGWDDFSNVLIAGDVALSYYAEVITGGPLDFACALVEDTGHGVGSSPFFNVHTSGAFSGSITPYRTTFNTRIAIYTRVPSSSTAFVVRVLVSDQPTTAAPSTTYCAYGTTLQPSIGGNIILTAGAITAFLQRFGVQGAILGTLIDAFVGRVLYTNALCASPPPEMPVMTQDDWLTGSPGIPSPQGLAKFWQGMLAAAWPYYCQCVPAPLGSPVPLDYPDPVIEVPPNAPGQLVPFMCDNLDLCAFLNQIYATLTRVSGQIAILRSDVTLIQRQHVPFAYVHGTRHSGLSASGTIAVQGILGISVETTTMPGYLSSDMDPVASYFKIGEISWGTEAGWSARRIVTHNPHLFLEVPGDVTAIAYLFELGVVANILELIREP